MNAANRLPHDFEAERRALGCAIINTESRAFVLEQLSGEHFFSDVNRKIFHALKELKDSGDIEFALCGKLPDHISEVAALADGLHEKADVQGYARTVKEKALLRGIIRAAHDIEQDAFAPGDEADTVLDRAKQSLGLLAPANGLYREPAGWREMFHSFEDFENAAPLSFAINGFLQNNGATMVGGLSGHGKTLLLLSVARALLAGRGRLWDLFDVEEKALRVIYLIPECAIQPFKHRLRLFGLYDYLAPSSNKLLVRTLSKGPTPCLSDRKILFAVKGAHVILDTAVRFSLEDENSATDNQRGLASDIFALLESGARSILAAHHSPKPFARENVMRLENVLRGSGDIGAMLTTAWGIKQLDATQNIIHVENIKPRDFQPCGPFQIIGRPHIDESGDFALLKKPGECGSLQDEQDPERDKGGGAPIAVREAKSANLQLLREWLTTDRTLSSQQLSQRFRNAGISIGDSAIRKYRKDLGL